MRQYTQVVVSIKPQTHRSENMASFRSLCISKDSLCHLLSSSNNIIHLCFLKLDLQRGHHSSLTLTRGPGLGALISHLLQPLSRLPALALFGTAFTSTEATWNTLTFLKFVRQGLTVYSPWLARNHFVDQAGLGQQSVHECVSLCVHRPRAGGGQRRV